METQMQEFCQSHATVAHIRRENGDAAKFAACKRGKSNAQCRLVPENRKRKCLCPRGWTKSPAADSGRRRCYSLSFIRVRARILICVFS